MKRALAFFSVVVALLVSGCAKNTPYDYIAFHQSKPESILVLPPSQSVAGCQGQP